MRASAFKAFRSTRGETGCAGLVWPGLLHGWELRERKRHQKSFNGRSPFELPTFHTSFCTKESRGISFSIFSPLTPLPERYFTQDGPRTKLFPLFSHRGKNPPALDKVMAPAGERGKKFSVQIGCVGRQYGEQGAPHQAGVGLPLFATVYIIIS